MKCEGETSVRDIEHGHTVYRCSLSKGHVGTHENRKRNIFWTADDIIWDYEINDYRAIA